MAFEGRGRSLWLIAALDFFSTKTLRKILYGVVAVGIYTAILDYLENYVLHVDFKPPYYLFSMLGTVLGLLLVFRTNTAYDRWWSGRIYMSDLMNTNRNMALKLNAYLPINSPYRSLFARLMASHAFAMKENLREGVVFEELDVQQDPEIIQRLEKAYHVPNEISNIMNEKIVEMKRNGLISAVQEIELYKHVDHGIDIVGGCERIRTSPMPHSYNIHLKKFVFYYTLLMPFGFIHELDYWSVLITMVIYYALAGLDAIGEEIEDPFGRDENDLPMDKICKSIRNSTSALLRV